MIGLAKFNEPGDLELIRRTLKNEKKLWVSLMAVKNYPDPTLFQDLLDIQSKALARENWLSLPETQALYSSLLEYENLETLDRFKYVKSLYDTLKPVGSHLDTTEIKPLIGFVNDESESIWEQNDDLEELKLVVNEHWGKMSIALLEEKKEYFSNFLSSLNLSNNDLHDLESFYGLNDSIEITY